jgi:hypothetical protein
MLFETSLTVSESKRLIGKGVAAMPAIRKAGEVGTIAIATGSTNGYCAEEIIRKPIEKTKYMTGATLPSGVERKGLLSREVPDIVLKRGDWVEGITLTEALAEMGSGDVFLKGANALHYATRRAGVLIGHPTGGTVGSALGTIIARRITFICPVGLEKCVAEPLEEAHEFITSDTDTLGPSLWVLPAQVVTEIEALKILTGADAMQTGAGGLAGAEGSVWLAIRGTPQQIDTAKALLNSLHGEPPFVREG